MAYLRDEVGGTCEVEVEVLRDEVSLLDGSLSVVQDGSMGHGLEVLSAETVDLQELDSKLYFNSVSETSIPQDTQPPYEVGEGFYTRYLVPLRGIFMYRENCS